MVAAASVCFSAFSLRACKPPQLVLGEIWMRFCRALWCAFGRQLPRSFSFLMFWTNQYRVEMRFIALRWAAAGFLVIGSFDFYFDLLELFFICYFVCIEEKKKSRLLQEVFEGNWNALVFKFLRLSKRNCVDNSYLYLSSVEVRYFHQIASRFRRVFDRMCEGWVRLREFWLPTARRNELFEEL